LSFNGATISATSASNLSSVSLTASGTGNLNAGTVNLGSGTVEALTITVGQGGTFSNAAFTSGNITKATIDIGAGMAGWTQTAGINAGITTASVAIGAGSAAAVTLGVGSNDVIGTVTISGAGTSSNTSYAHVTVVGSTIGSINASTYTGTLRITSTVASTDPVTITGGSGADTITGGGGADTITGGAGADSIIAGGGNDRIIYTVGAADVIDGGDGALDIVDLSGAAAAITVSNAFAVTAGSSGVNVTLTNVEGVISGAFDDTLSALAATASYVDGGAGNDGITGGSGADTLIGGSGSDTITGGTGADSITGGPGNDIYRMAAGDTVLTIGGSGNSGTISGFDTITDFRLGTASVVAELLGMTTIVEAVVANTAGTNGTDSTLTIGSVAVKSHAISSGIVTFDDADTFAAALTLSTDADLAAVVQYLQANDLGDAGATVAFVVGTDTYVFIQGDDGGTDNVDLLVKLTGVTGTSVSATNAATAGLIAIGG
jgi:Ca2+-binding RTX toxin-like protein